MQTIVQIIGYIFVISLLLVFLIDIYFIIIIPMDEFSKNRNLLEKIDRVVDYLLKAFTIDISILLISIVIYVVICYFK